jgi:hypothetical protein
MRKPLLLVTMLAALATLAMQFVPFTRAPTGSGAALCTR